jgi:cyclopropane-fatty-acyl-phospholipid synthase
MTDTAFRAEDFMRKYMWPNSSLPSATALITAAHASSQGRFTLQGVENHAAREFRLRLPAAPWSNASSSDYPRTLREWGRRLEANLTQDLVAQDYPELKDAADYESFKRKWQYLFAYAGAGFSKGYITCHMLTFIREVCTVQLTIGLVIDACITE